jgi:GrpB-like predicted nucleotidyltransferase (UPF0157 family)
MNTLEERIERAIREHVSIVPYDSQWPELFRREREHLVSSISVARLFPVSPPSPSWTFSWK